MAEQFELTDDMRAVIGKKSPPWKFEVTTTSVRAFARGVGYKDPVYFDIDAARQAGYRNLPVPPTYLGTPVFIPGRSDDTFSHPRLDGPVLRHGLKGLLDGGTETEYLDTICAGDVLTADSEVTSLDVRTSPKLGKMLLVSTLATYRNERNEVVALQRAQAIYY
jgi:hypothetical protein